MSEPSNGAIDIAVSVCFEMGCYIGDTLQCKQCRTLAEAIDAFAAKAVSVALSELEKRAVEDRDAWSSLKLHDKANAVDAIVVAIRVRIGRARGKDVENENA